MADAPNRVVPTGIPAGVCARSSLGKFLVALAAAWLARRWEDPAFPRSFTWFNTERYWADHILELREQMSAMQEEPLQLL